MYFKLKNEMQISASIDFMKLTKKELKQRYKPWVTFGLLNSMKRRDKLLKQYIRTKNYVRKQTIHNVVR